MHAGLKKRIQPAIFAVLSAPPQPGATLKHTSVLISHPEASRLPAWVPKSHSLNRCVTEVLIAFAIRQITQGQRANRFVAPRIHHDELVVVAHSNFQSAAVAFTNFFPPGFRVGPS